MKLFIARSPPELRTLFWQIAYENTDWWDFVRKVEDTLWLQFPDDERPNFQECAHLNATQKHATTKVIPHKVKLFVCKYHGQGNHDTDHCFVLKKWKKQNHYESNTKRNKTTTKRIKGDSNSTQNNEFIYTVFHNKFSKNLFRTPILIGNTPSQGLVDSGADVSIVHISVIPSKTQIYQLDKRFQIHSATGNTLRIIGQVKGLKISINGSEYLLNAYVTDHKPVYIILGVDFIINYPQVLNDIISRIRTQRISKSQEIRAKVVSSIDLQDQTFSKYENLFQQEIDPSRVCNVMKHKIETTSARPIKQMNQRIPVHWAKQIEDEIQKNLKLGIIRPSNSPWTSRIVPIKKTDGSLRLCIDYRPLNSITIKDNYPIPRIDEILDCLHDATVFSTLDATSGFYQIGIEESDIPKTAFAYKNGLYEFVRMPFGL
ncbi:MAG: reverse transcriptase family protein, partial [Aeromonas sp.]